MDNQSTELSGRLGLEPGATHPLASVILERANVSMIKDKEQLPRRPPLVNIYKLLCSAHWFIWNKSGMT